jgi:hypothetical protein
MQIATAGVTQSGGTSKAVIDHMQAQANLCVDTTASFQAFGGGWCNRANVPES